MAIASGLWLGLCCSTSQKPSQRIGNAYRVGTLDDEAEFAQLSEQELTMDSISIGEYSLLKSLMGSTADRKDPSIAPYLPPRFRDNRARLTLYATKAGQTSPRYKDPQPAPMPCECYTSGDSTRIKSYLGFFGGGGLTMTIKGGQVHAEVVAWIDQGAPYRNSVEDTTHTPELHARCERADLVLDHALNMMVGEKLNGFLEYRSVPFLERTYDGEDTVVSSGSLRFTCTTRAPVSPEQMR